VTRKFRGPLPARPQPLPNELLSSWLVRLARANALKYQELLTIVSGTRRSLMGRDLDASIDPGFGERLEQITGVPAAQLIALTYQTDRGNLTAIDQPKQGLKRWVLPMVSKLRRPTGVWLQLCVTCLREDTVPFIRRHWRYAFVTTCDAHATLMISNCPSCDAPFDFTTHDIGIDRAECVVPVSECSSCRCDVRYAQTAAVLAHRRVVRYERALCRAIDRGWTRVRGSGWVYSHQVFDVLHRLLRLLSSSKGLRQLFVEATAVNTLVDCEPNVPSGRFENWPLSARHQAMRWVSATFHRWPSGFVEQCTKFRVRSYAILGHRGEVPYWFEHIVRDYLYRPWYAPNAEEIESVRRAIAKAEQPDTVSNQRRWLGCYHQDSPFMRRITKGAGPRQFELFHGAAIAGKSHLTAEFRALVSSLVKTYRNRILGRLLAAIDELVSFMRSGLEQSLIVRSHFPAPREGVGYVRRQVPHKPSRLEQLIDPSRFDAPVYGGES